MESDKDLPVFRRGTRYIFLKSEAADFPAAKYAESHPRIFIRRYIHGATWRVSISLKLPVPSVTGVLI
jgi:hypothetical protein